MGAFVTYKYLRPGRTKGYFIDCAEDEATRGELSIGASAFVSFERPEPGDSWPADLYGTVRLLNRAFMIGERSARKSLRRTLGL